MNTLSQARQTMLALRGRLLRTDPSLWVLAFAATFMVTIWTSVAIEVDRDRADAIEEWSRNMTNLNRAFSEHTLRTLNGIDQDLKFIRNEYLRHGRALDLPGLAKKDGINPRAYIQIGVVDEHGNHVLSNRTVTRANVADREHFQWHRTDATDTMMLSKPLTSRTTGEVALQMTRRITDAQGHFKGIVVAAISPAMIGAIFSDLDVGKDGLSTLVGTDGIVRARRAGTTLGIGSNISQTRLFTDHHGEMEGIYVAPSRIDGIERLFTFRRIGEHPLILTLAVPLSRVYERSTERRDTYLAVAALVTLAILLLTRFILTLLRRQAQTVADLRESRAQAESANTLKSEFLASMSHELRTPLNGILGFADVIARKSVDEKSRRQAGLIRTSGSHLHELLNSILDLAKVEAGRMDLHIAEQDLAALVGSTAQIHQMTAGKKGLQLDVVIEVSAPEKIRADGKLLRQVLNNLLSNAIKFTEQGSITLRVWSNTHEPELVRFAVIDTGIGISEAALGLVFDKFRQVDQSVTRQHQGTGLGLALVKNFVELMGGQVAITSRLGAGTTISFVLPRNVVDVTPRPPAPERVVDIALV